MKPFKSFKTLKPFKTLSEQDFGFNDFNGASAVERSAAVERFEHPGEVRSYGHG